MSDQVETQDHGQAGKKPGQPQDSNQNSNQNYSDRSYQNRLHPEDQKKVDEFISRGVNSVERKPFKPVRMMLGLIGVVMVLSILAQFLARWAGIY